MLLFSFILTIVNIIVHFSTYFGIYFFNEYYPIFNISYIIHVLIFIPIVFIVIKSFLRNNNRINKLTFFESSNPFKVFKSIFPNTSYKIAIILLLIIIYVFINIYFSFNKLIDGMPEIINGTYVLNNKGDIIEINKQQYVELRYTMLKLFSGHWILFSIIPLIYFFDRKNNKI